MGGLGDWIGSISVMSQWYKGSWKGLNGKFIGALSWLHIIIMNHKIGIILRLIMTNDISIIGISVVT